MLYEDAKMPIKHINTAYSDFKRASGGMDHIIVFKKSTHVNIATRYISGTYCMTPHGNTPTISMHRGTLQGDTLSPFLFTIFMEPLLEWLSIGSQGYKHTHETEMPASTYITYDDHGYADDISITTGSLENLQTHITSSTYLANIHD